MKLPAEISGDRCGSRAVMKEIDQIALLIRFNAISGEADARQCPQRWLVPWSDGRPHPRKARTMRFSDDSGGNRLTVSAALKAVIDLEAELGFETGSPERQSARPDHSVVGEPHAIPGDAVLLAPLLTSTEPLARHLDVGERSVTDRVSCRIREDHM